MATADYGEAIALLRANLGKEEITEEDLCKVFLLVSAASNRPALGEKAGAYARALKEEGCDKVEDLIFFGRPFYKEMGMRYADALAIAPLLRLHNCGARNIRPSDPGSSAFVK